MPRNRSEAPLIRKKVKRKTVKKKAVAKPQVKTDFACPKCGSTGDFRYTEMVPCTYYVNVADGVATVDGDDSKTGWEFGTPEKRPFRCVECEHEFKAGNMRVAHS